MKYTLKRSKRRTLAIEVTREGNVIVRAPHDCRQEEIDSLLYRRQDWVKKALETQYLRNLAHPQPNSQQEIELKERAKAEIPPRVTYYAEIMGLSPSGISITGAKTRFGSCSPKNRLCFSWRLMQYPADAVDGVIVHELAHIVHKNHGPQFYELVYSILPDYKERKKLLK